MSRGFEGKKSFSLPLGHEAWHRDMRPGTAIAILLLREACLKTSPTTPEKTAERSTEKWSQILIV